MEISDEQMAQQAAQGDPGAFEQLVAKYKKRIYYAAYRMTSNHSEADDIAQDTFIKAYRKLKDFRGRSKFYTWLYRILVNCCIDSLRRRKRRGEFEFSEAIDLDRRAETTAAPADALGKAELNELREAVSGALGELPPKHRAVLVLHEFEGMSHGDIAAILGCSAGTVRSRLHYARMKMQKKLRKFL